MAKQFSATVQGQSVSFPSSLVRIIGLSSGASIEYLGANYIADEVVTDLISAANTDGTEQVSATVLRVNDAVQTFPITMGFPASLISIYPSTLSGSLSVIVYNNVFYYAGESKTALEDAANTSSGGGVTIYTGDGSLSGDRSIDLDGHDLNIETSENYFFLLQPSIFRAQMQAIGDGTRYSLIDARASSDDDTYFDFTAFDGTNTAEIKGSATDSSIIYSADTHTFNGKVFSSTSEETGSNTSTATLDARNATGDGNNAGQFNSSSDVLATAQLQADYQDGTKDASISVQAQASGSSITHTADTHTFNVGITITELAGVGTRAIAVDANGKVVLL